MKLAVLIIGVAHASSVPSVDKLTRAATKDGAFRKIGSNGKSVCAAIRSREGVRGTCEMIDPLLANPFCVDRTAGLKGHFASTVAKTRICCSDGSIGSAASFYERKRQQLFDAINPHILSVDRDPCRLAVSRITSLDYPAYVGAPPVDPALGGCSSDELVRLFYFDKNLDGLEAIADIYINVDSKAKLSIRLGDRHRGEITTVPPPESIVHVPDRCKSLDRVPLSAGIDCAEKAGTDPFSNLERIKAMAAVRSIPPSVREAWTALLIQFAVQKPLASSFACSHVISVFGRDMKLLGESLVADIAAAGRRLEAN